MKLRLVLLFVTIISFNMSAQSQKPVFSFGVIADVQYADADPAGTRFYRSSTGKLREALSDLKSDSVSLVLNLGDLIDKDFTSYKPIRDLLDSSGLRFYHVAGNHDYSVEAKYKKRLPVLSSSKNGYYSLVVENFRFIFLNGNEISTYTANNKASVSKATGILEGMKAKAEINAVDWNGGMSSDQILWLKSQLDLSNSAEEKVFIVCHFPLVPENVHNLLNYKDVLSLLKNYHNIIAWFNGHNHSGNYGNFNQIHFVTFRGMVETDSVNSYARVDVYRNKIWITGKGREKNKILAY
jgi:manganese-dependent ADP-ribose/CDP-alcohol diphosphatase